jgi:hypothetical protein
MDRAHIERVLIAARWNCAQAASQLGLHPNTLRHRLMRLGIQRPARPAAPVEQHPPSAAVVAALDSLRTEARLLFRSYGQCPHRVQELARIEARMRYLRGLLRSALGDGEGGQGMVRSPSAPGVMRPAWGQRW